MSSIEADRLHPTEQEVEDWFRENFGLALFPSESRKEWVKKNWDSIVASGRCEDFSATSQSLQLELRAEKGCGEKATDGPNVDLLERLCPDLVGYFETEPKGLYVTADPIRGSFEMEHSRAEVEALKNRVEELEILVKRLAEETLRRTGHERPESER